MNIKPYKSTTFKDLRIDFINSETDAGTITIIFTFTDEAVKKNVDLLKKVKKGLSPNKNITGIRATRQIIIDRLPTGIFFNHYPHQLVELIIQGKIHLDMTAQHPLNHEQSVGDIRSSKRCNDKEKTILSLKKEVRVLQLKIEKIEKQA
jgi:hypothetical protein